MRTNKINSAPSHKTAIWASSTFESLLLESHPCPPPAHTECMRLSGKNFVELQHFIYDPQPNSLVHQLTALSPTRPYTLFIVLGLGCHHRPSLRDGYQNEFGKLSVEDTTPDPDIEKRHYHRKRQPRYVIRKLIAYESGDRVFVWEACVCQPVGVFAP